jgi:uncharacterized membrane protein YhaH (DUF805 family)
MNFVDAIKTCFTKYADFKGCATRPEFWWWVLFTIVGSMALGVIHGGISAAFSIATLIPSIAVCSRRLHDVDKSGWMQLIGLIPLVGWIVVIYWCAQPGTTPNRFTT